MSNQLVCDGCEKPIDTTQPYYTITLTKVKAQVDETSGDPTGGTEVVEPSKTYDYHEDHLPKKLTGDVVETT